MADGLKASICDPLIEVPVPKSAAAAWYFKTAFMSTT